VVFISVLATHYHPRRGAASVFNSALFDSATENGFTGNQNILTAFGIGFVDAPLPLTPAQQMEKMQQALMG
jgi:hypothetical protein